MSISTGRRKLVEAAISTRMSPIALDFASCAFNAGAIDFSSRLLRQWSFESIATRKWGRLKVECMKHMKSSLG